MTLIQRLSHWSARHPAFAAFLLGAFLGLFASSIYIIAGGDTFLYVPIWAAVIFYPGFIVGNLVYNAIGFGGAHIAGIVTISVFYGLLASGARLIFWSGRARS